jgi:glycine/D-amino acid oxidase-like deaminating enzyme
VKTKIIVVGAGVAGLCVAWSLVRRGCSVEVFDQGAIPNPLSSSWDEHRITCHNYGAHDGYARMMPAAFKAYDALFDDLGAKHYLPTGIAFVRRQRDDWYETEARKLDALGVPHRELAEAEIATRLPMLRRDAVRQVVEFGGAGLLFARPLLEDIAAWLMRRGVVLHTGSRVESVDFDGGRIKADQQTHAADIVVVAAGAWAAQIAPQIAARVRPSRQTIVFLEPPDDLRAAWAHAPILVADGGTHPGYALPPRNGTRLKIGGHHFNRYGEPDEDRSAIPEEVAPIEAVGREAFSRFDRYRILETKANYITSAGEERFLVHPLGRAGWLVSACSGHGFKLAPLIANGVAAAIAGDRDPESVQTWAAGY